jgi:hypothetical protein
MGHRRRVIALEVLLSCSASSKAWIVVIAPLTFTCGFEFDCPLSRVWLKIGKVEAHLTQQLS